MKITAQLEDASHVEVAITVTMSLDHWRQFREGIRHLTTHTDFFRSAAMVGNIHLLCSGINEVTQVLDGRVTQNFTQKPGEDS